MEIAMKILEIVLGLLLVVAITIVHYAIAGVLLLGAIGGLGLAILGFVQLFDPESDTPIWLSLLAMLIGAGLSWLASTLLAHDPLLFLGP
jgi:hypothetical protein